MGPHSIIHLGVCRSQQENGSSIIQRHIDAKNQSNSGNSSSLQGTNVVVLGPNSIIDANTRATAATAAACNVLTWWSWDLTALLIWHLQEPTRKKHQWQATNVSILAVGPHSIIHLGICRSHHQMISRNIERHPDGNVRSTAGASAKLLLPAQGSRSWKHHL